MGLGVVFKGKKKGTKRTSGRVTFSNRFDLDQINRASDDEEENMMGDRDAVVRAAAADHRVGGGGGGGHGGHGNPSSNQHHNPKPPPKEPPAHHPHDMYRMGPHAPSPPPDSAHPSLAHHEAYMDADTYARTLAADDGHGDQYRNNMDIPEALRDDRGVARAVASGATIRSVSASGVLASASNEVDRTTAIKIAMGADYQAKIRTEAGSVSGKEKSRNQITSLMHQAKLNEVELMVGRTQGRSKFEQGKKYGW